MITSYETLVGYELQKEPKLNNNFRLVCYEITLILIECLTDSVICNFKMTYGEILAVS